MSDDQLNKPDDLQKPDSNPEEENTIKPKYSPVAAAFIGLIAVFILYQVGGSLLTIAIFGFDLKNADITSLRLLTTAGQLLFILLPALIFAKSIYVDVNKIIRLKLPHISEIFLFSIGLVLLATLLQSYLYIQNFILIKLADAFPLIDKAKNFFDKIDSMVEETYASLLTYHSVFEASFIIFVVAVIPAICEETFFRGFVQKSFELKYKPFFSALITAVFFGIYHFHPYQIIPLVMLGLYFGFAAYKTNSIFVPMSMHFLNNFIALMLFFVLGKDQISTPMNVSFSDLKVSVISFLGFKVLFSMLILYINRYYYRVKKTNDQKYNDENKSGFY
jgi:membrane protease YdiL (CAAX protease family)